MTQTPQAVKTCPKCNTELHLSRVLTGPLLKNGRCEVWAHQHGYACCYIKIFPDGTVVDAEDVK